ncbi:Phenylpropionate dioxygenase, large terminal subunit [Pseudomonas synxantha]|uniref:Phenylpropionate dioxygenase, large terminal subunit n=1 Tax=Pseudomonas synxantha TaxID=47883 RepID=A0A3G7U1F7_9PSED|nr:Rieske 2Fe-2S domain-containing protein [Pseudomonas synxantha]AZE52991.1 Phenylpropionate dioxygenase, large terminal subunit [Pseudomonas synxantha]
MKLKTPDRATDDVTRYPNGWFAASYSRELKTEAVLTVPFMGQELVLYRTRSGTVHAVNPYCPHLGAHFGHGGKVENEDLVCPFHGFTYGPSGNCIRTGSCHPPPHARLTNWPVDEKDGVIYVWHHHEGRPPSWNVPSLDLEGYSPLRGSTFEIPGDSQDMAENSADAIHFAWVHRVKNASITQQIDGHKMTNVMEGCVNKLSVKIRISCHGMGFAAGDTELFSLGLRIITQSLATQTTPHQWTLRLANAIHIKRLDILPAVVRNGIQAVLGLLMQRWFMKEVKNDFAIWFYRSHPEHPKLIAEERNMVAFRRWMAQFYPLRIKTITHSMETVPKTNNPIATDATQ